MKTKSSTKSNRSGSTVRLTPEIHAKIEEYSALLNGTSINSVATEFLKSMISMVETPVADRSVPKIVLTIDAVRKVPGIVKMSARI